MFPQKDSDEDREVIAIIGRREAVEAARDHLRKTISDLVRVRVRGEGGGSTVASFSGGHMTLPRPQANIVEEEMTVEKEFHKHFVMRRGQVSC